MSNDNPVIAQQVRAPIDSTEDAPAIAIGGDEDHSSGNGIFGGYNFLGFATEYTERARIDSDGLSLQSDVRILVGSGVPVDGTTGANVAGPGSLYIRASGANSNAYINCNTKASPTWKLITRAA